MCCILSHAANYAIEMPVLYYRFYISFNILVCIRVSTNYLHVAVLIGGGKRGRQKTIEKIVLYIQLMLTPRSKVTIVILKEISFIGGNAGVYMCHRISKSSRGKVKHYIYIYSN